MQDLSDVDPYLTEPVRALAVADQAARLDKLAHVIDRGELAVLSEGNNPSADTEKERIGRNDNAVRTPLSQQRERRIELTVAGRCSHDQLSSDRSRHLLRDLHQSVGVCAS